MLIPSDDMQLFVAVDPIDMRKAVNGLVQMIAEMPSQDPKSGHLYIFRNKRSDLIKAVF